MKWELNRQKRSQSDCADIGLERRRKTRKTLSGYPVSVPRSESGTPENEEKFRAFHSDVQFQFNGAVKNPRYQPRLVKVRPLLLRAAMRFAVRNFRTANFTFLVLNALSDAQLGDATYMTT